MYIWLHIEFLTAVIKISQISSSQWTCSKENFHILWIGSHNAETIYVLFMKIGDIKKFQNKMLFSKSNTYILYRQSFLPKQIPAATFPSKLSNLATTVGELRMEALFEPNSPYWFEPQAIICLSSVMTTAFDNPTETWRILFPKRESTNLGNRTCSSHGNPRR